MGREIYDIINDMAEVLNASQMQKLQEVLVKRLSENTVSDYLQTTNMDFLDMFLTAKHLEGCSNKTIRGLLRSTFHYVSPRLATLRIFISDYNFLRLLY